MNCSLCTTPTPPLELLTVWLSGERRLEVCPDCIKDAVAGMVAETDEAKARFCRGCPQLSGDVCRQGVTPDTCA